MKKYYIKLLIGIIGFTLIYLLLDNLMNADVINPYKARILMLIGINIILAVSLNLVLGFTGQLTLGHAGFMAIGAYVAAVVSVKLQAPFLVALIAGGLASGFIGMLIGLPVLKLKGDYLAITTLAFGQIILNVINNINFIGGPRGYLVPAKTTFFWVFALTIISVFIIRNIIKSSQGRAMVSVREDEIAAEAMGINAFKYKVMAFTIASFFAGIAGGLFAHLQRYITPSIFDFMKSVDVVTSVVLGGMGSITGTVLATAAITYLPEGLRKFSEYRMIIYPILLIVIMRFRPKGLLGTNEISFKGVQKLYKKLKDKGGKNNAAA